MPSDLPFHLGRGDTGPVQQSPVTCGSAALTVARMLANPEFARWVVGGKDRLGGHLDVRSEQERFAEYERVVMSRTNGFRTARSRGTASGRYSIPWPHALGTPPWGAKRELEYAAARPDAAYAVRWVRVGSSEALREAHRDLVRIVREGLPALLYIGNAWFPRHITLVLPGRGLVRDGGVGLLEGDGLPEGGGLLNVYDPATGSVAELAAGRFASRTLGIAGWNVPWFAIQPH